MDVNGLGALYINKEGIIDLLKWTLLFKKSEGQLSVVQLLDSLSVTLRE